jgi:hypothetical protein
MKSEKNKRILLVIHKIRFRKKIYFFLFVNILPFWITYGQSMLSPYSFFGIGQIHKTGTGISSGMGGTGIAMSSDLSLNPMNPASYSSIDSHHFLFDFGFTVKQSLYNSNQSFGKHFDGMIRKVAIGFKPFEQNWYKCWPKTL